MQAMVLGNGFESVLIKGQYFRRIIYRNAEPENAAVRFVGVVRAAASGHRDIHSEILLDMLHDTASLDRLFYSQWNLVDGETPLHHGEVFEWAHHADFDAGTFSVRTWLHHDGDDIIGIACSTFDDLRFLTTFDWEDFKALPQVSSSPFIPISLHSPLQISLGPSFPPTSMPWPESPPSTVNTTLSTTLLSSLAHSWRSLLFSTPLSHKLSLKFAAAYLRLLICDFDLDLTPPLAPDNPGNTQRPTSNTTFAAPFVAPASFPAWTTLSTENVFWFHGVLVAVGQQSLTETFSTSDGESVEIIDEIRAMAAKQVGESTVLILSPHEAAIGSISAGGELLFTSPQPLFKYGVHIQNPPRMTKEPGSVSSSPTGCSASSSRSPSPSIITTSLRPTPQIPTLPVEQVHLEVNEALVRILSSLFLSAPPEPSGIYARPTPLVNLPTEILLSITSHLSRRDFLSLATAIPTLLSMYLHTPPILDGRKGMVVTVGRGMAHNNLCEEVCFEDLGVEGEQAGKEEGYVSLILRLRVLGDRRERRLQREEVRRWSKGYYLLEFEGAPTGVAFEEI